MKPIRERGLIGGEADIYLRDGCIFAIGLQNGTSLFLLTVQIADVLCTKIGQRLSQSELSDRRVAASAQMEVIYFTRRGVAS